MTEWIMPSDEVARKVVGLDPVPLPVSEPTAAAFATGEPPHPANLALEVDAWLRAGGANTDPELAVVLGRYVAGFGYFGALELMSRGRHDLAVAVLQIAHGHAPDDPAIRARLGVALWETGERYEGMLQLVEATQEYARAERVAPQLTILTARVLADAGRYDAALELLAPLEATDPPVPYFGDLGAGIAQRKEHSASR